jgi:hypothetical protein
MSEIIKLNDRDFEFDCVFINATADDKTNPLNPVSYGSFEYIEFTDSLFKPFIECSFGIDNPLNFIEKQPGEKPFRFSANSRNFCNIILTPVDTKDSKDEYIQNANTLEILGVLNEGATISANKSDASISTFDVIDTKLASLREVKVGYVFQKIDTSKTVSQNIKDILLITHNNDESVIDKKFNIGEAGGVTITTNYPFPLDYNLEDALHFLLKFNIATVNNIDSQLFLKYDNHTKTYKNTSMYELFNDATSAETNAETFIIGGKEGEEVGKNSPKFIIETFKDNIIHNVNFSNLNFEISNSELLPVYYTTTSDPKNISQLSFVSLEEQIENFKVNVLNTASMKTLYGDNIELNVQLDESKKNQQNYKIISTNFNDDVNKKLAHVQMYNSFLFQNMTLSFKALGQPFRKAGVFIMVTRASDTQGIDGDEGGKEFDNKLVGQWLVTTVTHKITKGIYETFIQCVKPFKVV